MDERELVAGLDACRNADDLRQPELRALAGQVASDERAREMQVRLLRIDRAVRESLDDVLLPVGLEERLVARLCEAAHDAAIGDPTAADMPSPRRLVAVIPNVFARKCLQWGGAAAATAAAVAVGLSREPRYDTLSPTAYGRMAVAKELSEAGGWQPFNAGDVA
jgi:hypothetical protein